MKSVVRSIQERHSVRSYSGKSIENNKLKRLKDFLSNNTAGPFGNRVRFQIVDVSDYNKEQLNALGVYGIMKGAKLFIAGSVSKGPYAMEDFGFCMEKNILLAASLDLDTCWMGGMLERSEFAAKIAVLEGEIIPAVTPIGYESGRKTIGSQALSFLMRSGKRKPFGEIFLSGANGSPLKERECGKYAEVLECVRLAPSAGNMQPWRVVKAMDTDTFHFYQKEKVAYNTNKRYEGARLQNVDMGIAMCHFDLAAAEVGLSGKWEISDAAEKIEDLNYIATWKGK